MSDIFISYKREDRKLVEPLIALLLDLELDVWFDDGIEVGEEWGDRIERELNDARAVLVCWTFAAISSQWVTREADAGLAAGKLTQVRLLPCSPLERFDKLQAADLSDWHGTFDHPEIQKTLFALQPLTGNASLARNARLRAGGQHEEMVHLLRSILVARAREKGPAFTYGEAADVLKEAAEKENAQIGEFDQHTLWGALDGVAEQNRKRREPPLHALVVSKESGLPGRGYWQKHVFLAGDGSELERVVFNRQIERVRDWDWSRDP